MKEYQQYLLKEQRGISLGEAKQEDLEAFVLWYEVGPKKSAKTHLWALRYYYQFTGNEMMRVFAGELRQVKIKRKPFALENFRGVNSEYITKLTSVGIENVVQMLDAGRTAEDRQHLTNSTDIPLDNILELVKLSDLARLPGVKGIRARLYYDACVDSLEKMAQWDSQDLRLMLIDFVERTEFEGMAPLSKEAKNAVKTARKLPKIIEY